MTTSRERHGGARGGAGRRGAGAGARELGFWWTRIPKPEERPVPEEDAPWEAVPPELAEEILDHLDGRFSFEGGTFFDTAGPNAIDVVLIEPGRQGRWGGCVTLGASAVPLAVPESERGRWPERVELIAALPPGAFRYWEGSVLEPLEEGPYWVVDMLGELARHAQSEGVCFRPPQVVATPDRGPMLNPLPFPGVLVTDSTRSHLHVPPLVRPTGEVVTFLSVIPLYASEVEALSGADAAAVLDRIERSRPRDGLLDERAAVA